MEKIIMLGTGNAMALQCYNTCFVMQKEDCYVLVDGGGGNRILKQLELANIPLTSINYAIITHAHTDHILGMIWIYRMIATKMLNGSYSNHFFIYCHDEVKVSFEAMLQFTLPAKLLKLLGEQIHIVAVKDGERVEIMKEEFVFFDIASTKMKQFGFFTESAKGRVVCLGDEPCANHIKPILKDAYMVLSEAFCLYEDRDIFKPYEKHHSTVKDASQLAQDMNVQNLILYHTEETNLDTRKQRYTKEAKQYFFNTIYVPDDLEEILI